MNLALPILVVGLPFVSAAALGVVPSWRIGSAINAASAGLLFLLTCFLPGAASTALHVGAVQAHLALLTGFVAMTTGWFGVRHVRAALDARRTGRRRVRIQHVAFQALLGATMLALLSDSPALTWLALAIAVAAAASASRTSRGAAPDAALRVLALCAVGLMLALFGTLLLYLAAEPNPAALRWSALLPVASPRNAALEPACIFLLLSYGTLAGLVPLHGWLVEAAAGPASNAIGVTALLVNAPLLVILRLHSLMRADLLLALGLASLLLAALGLSSRLDPRRPVAFSGMALVGLIVFASGLAAPFAALLLMTLLSLARAAALQCEDLSPARASAWTSTACVVALAALPPFALFLTAGAAVDRSAWLLPPLGIGVLLTSCALIARLPVSVAPAAPHGGANETLALAPIWLQLALLLMLAVAMPEPVLDWFRAMAGSIR